MVHVIYTREEQARWYKTTSTSLNLSLLSLALYSKYQIDITLLLLGLLLSCYYTSGNFYIYIGAIFSTFIFISLEVTNPL